MVEKDSPSSGKDKFIFELDEKCEKNNGHVVIEKHKKCSSSCGLWNFILKMFNKK